MDTRAGGRGSGGTEAGEHLLELRGRITDGNNTLNVDVGGNGLSRTSCGLRKLA
jgi:hypothetical protein